MTDIFYEKREYNYLDNLKIDVKKLYDQYPENTKVNAKPYQIDFINNFFCKIYRNGLIPLKIRRILWYYFRTTSLDATWLEEFNKYWITVLKGRPLRTVFDLFHFKNVYRIKFQDNILPDTTDPNIHLEAWQRPELLYQLLALVSNSYRFNELEKLILLRKNKKDFKSFLEFGCATAPITTSFFEFFHKPKDIKIFISDIQTLAFHYAIYKFRKCSNVIPIILTPSNDFLLKLDEKVDVIFCITVLEHLNKPLETIEIFHKILNDKGLLIFDYIKTAGGGLDSLQSAKMRDSVIDYLIENFKLISGKLTREKNIGFTIVKKI